MSDAYLLDSSVLVEILRHHHKYEEMLEQVLAAYISSVGLGELYYGAFHAKSDNQEGIAEVNAVVQDIPILPIDSATALLYGEIKEGLSAKGRMIPENDIWIAATARRYGLSLATCDAHFNHIDGLSVEQW